MFLLVSFSATAQFKIYDGTAPNAVSSCVRIRPLTYFTDNETPKLIFYEPLWASECEKARPAVITPKQEYKPAANARQYQVDPKPAQNEYVPEDRPARTYQRDDYYNSGGCFAAGTQITMADGTRKPIESVKADDKVQVYNVDTKKIETSAVKGTDQYDSQLTADVTIGSDAAPGQVRHIHMTVNHPLYLVDFNSYHSLLNLDDQTDLKGQKVLMHADSGDDVAPAQIIDIRLIKELRAQSVYNLVIESDAHNFFADGLLVHNRIL